MNIPRIAAWLQLDKSLSMSVLSRVWQAISGPMTIALLLITMDLQEQGVFSVILNIVAIQSLFELGFGSVIIGQAGNLVGRSQRPSAAGANLAELSADSQHELWSLTRVATQWFAAIAALYALCAWWIGWKSLSGSIIDLIDWRWPLGLSVALAAITFAVSSRVYILEGAGQREYVYRVRLWQAVIGSLTMWLALWSGLKLWAIVGVFAVGAMFQLYLAFGTRAQLLLGSCDILSGWRSKAEVEHSSGRSALNSSAAWFAKIAPVQWRAAASSAAHYLASQLMILYVTNYHGVTLAAPLGLTLQVTVAVQAVALAWAQTKFPLIARYQTAGERERAGTLWRHTTLVSAGLLSLAMLGLAALVSCLPLAGQGWEDRFVAPWLILVLAVGYLANHGLALQAYYVLARGAKPLVGPAVIGLLITAGVVWWGAKYYQVPGVICGYSVAMACVALPIHTWAYLRFRQSKVSSP
jgi:hypothetical protein